MRLKTRLIKDPYRVKIMPPVQLVVMTLVIRCWLDRSEKLASFLSISDAAFTALKVAKCLFLAFASCLFRLARYSVNKDVFGMDPKLRSRSFVW